QKLRPSRSKSRVMNRRKFACFWQKNTASLQQLAISTHPLSAMCWVSTRLVAGCARGWLLIIQKRKSNVLSQQSLLYKRESIQKSSADAELLLFIRLLYVKMDICL